MDLRKINILIVGVFFSSSLWANEFVNQIVSEISLGGKAQYPCLEADTSSIKALEANLNPENLCKMNTEALSNCEKATDAINSIASSKIQDFNARQNDLEAKEKALQDQVEALQDQVEALQDQAEDLEAKEKALQAISKAFTSQRQNLQARQGDLRFKIAEKEAQLGELSTEKRDLKHQYKQILFPLFKYTGSEKFIRSLISEPSEVGSYAIKIEENKITFEEGRSKNCEEKQAEDSNKDEENETSAENTPDNESEQVDLENSSTRSIASRNTRSNFSFNPSPKTIRTIKRGDRPTGNSPATNNDQTHSQINLKEATQTNPVTSTGSNLPEEFKYTFDDEKESPSKEDGLNQELASGNKTVPQQIHSNTLKATSSLMLPTSSFTARSGRRTKRDSSSSLPSSSSRPVANLTKLEKSPESQGNLPQEVSPEVAKARVGSSQEVKTPDTAKKTKKKSQDLSTKSLAQVLARLGKALDNKKNQALKKKSSGRKLAGNVKSPASFNKEMKRSSSLQTNFQEGKLQPITLARNDSKIEGKRRSKFSHQSIFIQMSQLIQRFCLEEETNCY